MEIIRGIDSFHLYHQEPIYLALGNFDGVHCGHQVIIRTTVDLARAHNKKSAVLIFSPHPTMTLRPERTIKLLLTVETASACWRSRCDYIIHPFTLNLPP